MSTIDNNKKMHYCATLANKYTSVRYDEKRNGWVLENYEPYSIKYCPFCGVKL